MRKSDFFREAREDLPGPLVGLRVVEATTTWAGPMCGCILADFGADVVKVEEPHGEIARRSPPFLPGVEPPLSFMHATVNRNKRSLTLDLRSPRGQEIFRSLTAEADVVVENFRPGVLQAWGLDYEAVRVENPGIVYASISGYGQYGPEHDRVGYDPLAQAASGFLSLNGDPQGGPVKSPTFLADDLAGLHAALAVLAALRHRDATGEGQHIDISLLDCLLFQSTGYLTLGAMGVDLPRLGNQFRIAAPANVYECRDGWLMAGVLLDTHWRRLAILIGRPELAEHPDYAVASARLARRTSVDGLLAEFCRELPVEELVARFADAGIPAAKVRSYHEAARDPHVAAREMLQPTFVFDSQRGREVRIPITAPPAKLSRTPIRVRTPAPDLGQHKREILRELGYDEQEIDELDRAGVL